MPTVDVETYVKQITGRPYITVANELVQAGFSERKNVRLHGTTMKNRARYTRGKYGASTNIDIEYDWVDKMKTGVCTPGKVLKATIVREKNKV